jgi:UPF0755 protein
MKKIFITISILLFLVIAGLFALRQSIEYQYTRQIDLVLNQILTINSGDSINTVANKVFNSDKDKFVFTKIAGIKNRDTDIKTGEFLIPEKVSIEELLDIVSSNNTINYKVTIIEGYQKYQMASVFNGIKNMSGDNPIVTQEGIFMPDTYYYKTGDTKASVLKRANNAMDKYLTNAWDNRDESLPIKTKREALILASIVERETGQSDEYKLVSSVFMNRLKRGMKLQADSTSIYGITNGERKFNRKLYTGDLAQKNSYNTYYIKSLPKEPICNPGKEAIDAVMHPADTKYLYFVADGTGGHVFAKTGKEHERNVVQWRKIKNGK